MRGDYVLISWWEREPKFSRARHAGDTLIMFALHPSYAGTMLVPSVLRPTSGTSLTKSSGPKTKPCGTPNKIDRGVVLLKLSSVTDR